MPVQPPAGSDEQLGWEAPRRKIEACGLAASDESKSLQWCEVRDVTETAHVLHLFQKRDGPISLIDSDHVIEGSSLSSSPPVFSRLDAKIKLAHSQHLF